MTRTWLHSRNIEKKLNDSKSKEATYLALSNKYLPWLFLFSYQGLIWFRNIIKWIQMHTNNNSAIYFFENKIRYNDKYSFLTFSVRINEEEYIKNKTRWSDIYNIKNKYDFCIKLFYYKHFSCNPFEKIMIKFCDNPIFSFELYIITPTNNNAWISYIRLQKNNQEMAE